MQINDVVLGLHAGVGLDLAPDGKSCFYVEWAIGELSKVDLPGGAVTTLKTGLAYPQDVELDWATGEIFVSERTGAILQIWPGERAKRIATPGGAPHQLALVKKGGQRHLYTVCFDSGKLVRINLATGTLQTIASGLGHPIGLVVDATQKYAYVTEQDTASLSRIEILTGIKTTVYAGLISPFFLHWDRTGTGIFCVQRDPSNSLVKISLGPPVTLSTIANGLGWRPSGVAPTTNNKLIYICADRQLQVLSANGVPPVPPPPRPFEIYSIQFNYDGSRAIPLKESGGGAALPLPEYVKGVRNRQAAYIGGTLPHIKVVLRRLPGFIAGTYSIGATGSHGGVRRKDVTPVFNAAGFTSPIDFELMWPLPGAVGKPNVSLDWYARKMPGPAIPVSVGSAAHKLYIVLARPTDPWVVEHPWVTALELTCGWAAGATTLDAAATLITERYNGSGRVSYDTTVGATLYGTPVYNLTQMIDRMNGGSGLGPKVNCTDSANTVSTLANLLGCELWQSQMASGFYMNPIIAIGYTTWAVPFWGGFGYHEVAWKGACTANDNLFDGCLKVDGDADPTTAPHTPLLPTNMLFGGCNAMNYRLRLCLPVSTGCAQCQPQPGATRQRRSII